MYPKAILLVAELTSRQRHNIKYDDQGDRRIVSPMYRRSIKAQNATPRTSKYPKKTPT